MPDTKTQTLIEYPRNGTAEPHAAEPCCLSHFEQYLGRRVLQAQQLKPWEKNQDNEPQAGEGTWDKHDWKGTTGIVKTANALFELRACSDTFHKVTSFASHSFDGLSISTAATAEMQKFSHHLNVTAGKTLRVVIVPILTMLSSLAWRWFKATDPFIVQGRA